VDGELDIAGYPKIAPYRPKTTIQAKTEKFNSCWRIREINPEQI